MVVQATGYCDLNIDADSKDLKKLVLQTLCSGYQTLAINTFFDPEKELEKQKSEGSNQTPISIPEPTTVNITPQDLKQYKIDREFVILSRITIRYSELESGFVHRLKEDHGKYDLIAFSPCSVEALKQIIETFTFTDIISFDLSWSDKKLPKLLLSMAVAQDIYFELNYSPCIGLHQVTSRGESIQLARRFLECNRSKNVFVSSGINSDRYLRRPNEVINLCCVMFSLSEALSHCALVKTTHDLVHCSQMRRNGVDEDLPIIKINKSRSKKNGLKRKRDDGSMERIDQLKT